MAMTRISLLAGLGLVALAACSSDKERPLSIPGQAAVSALMSRSEASDISLSDRQILALPGSVLIVNNPKAGTRVGFQALGLNNNAVQWRSDNGTAITTLGGQIISTAGYGFDLDSADIPAIVPGQPALRDHFFYADTARIERRRFRCQFSDERPETIEIAGRPLNTMRVDEVCVAEDGLQIQNRYHKNAAGQVIASRQFVHPEIGYLELQNTQAVK